MTFIMCGLVAVLITFIAKALFKIRVTKLAKTLEIDCFLTCNNQFCFCLKECSKVMYVLGCGFYWNTLYMWAKLLICSICTLM